mmetsp:Transcript_23180/g.41882  ORF Transcript_23180/g.41882 Transcript_23180/m.41882 type:complete len:108 (+) Transcript_23180:219-542(+)
MPSCLRMVNNLFHQVPREPAQSEQIGLKALEDTFRSVPQEQAQWKIGLKTVDFRQLPRARAQTGLKKSGDLFHQAPREPTQLTQTWEGHRGLLEALEAWPPKSPKIQ